MLKLIRDLSRGVLSEGRNEGISLAFAQKTEEEFTEVMPLSACKDYLNDALWAEHENKTSKERYGFIHKPRGILKDDKIYLSTAKVTNNKEALPTKYDLTNHLNFIHQIEDQLKIQQTIVYETDRYEVLEIDKYWAQYPYLISLYGLLWREAANYKEGDPVKYMTKSVHKYSFRGLENLKFLLVNEAPYHTWDRPISQVHNQGIQSINVSLLSQQLTPAE